MDVVTLPGCGCKQTTRSGDCQWRYCLFVYGYLDNRILGQAKTQYRNIIETIQGTMVTGNYHAHFTKGKVVVASATARHCAKKWKTTIL